MSPNLIYSPTGEVLHVHRARTDSTLTAQGRNSTVRKIGLLELYSFKSLIDVTLDIYVQ